MVFWGDGREECPPQKAASTKASATHEGGASPAPTKERKRNSRRPEGRRYRGLEDGAGFGYVGVEFVDEVGVLLFDYAALEFHGEG
jgi:hypothetical protein